MNKNRKPICIYDGLKNHYKALLDLDFDFHFEV